MGKSNLVPLLDPAGELMQHMPSPSPNPLVTVYQKGHQKPAWGLLAQHGTPGVCWVFWVWVGVARW